MHARLILQALRNSVSIIVDTIRQAIDQTPPELIADLMEHGIALAGGGALLKGLAQRLTEETKMKVYVAEDPLSCVARGAGMVLENFEILQETLASMQRGSTLH
jgi:rod shape-determining protein MreB